MDTHSPPEDLPDSARIVIRDDARVTLEKGDLVGRDKIVGYTSEQVGVLIAGIRSTFQPKPFDGRSPYVGLASFQEADADRFFGREKLTQDLVARVAASRFVVIAGPSGSGKSSLARAGLMHALKEGGLPGSERWLYESMTPGRTPLEQLRRVVSSFAGRTSAGDELVAGGRTDETLLHRWADIALGDQSSRRAVLLVDQFEEVFTQVTTEAERAAFLNLLVYAGTVENGRVTIVCCTRSDFIGNWAAYPNLNAQLSLGVNQIPPMQDDELVSAIARPVLQVGLQIDPELVKQILDDMRDAPGALPLMQFALDDLFEYEKSKRGLIALTRDDYLERGGLQKALARHADTEFAKLSADEQQIARTVFAGLIEPGRGTVDTKRTALFQELVPSGTDPAQTQAVIDKLADARLITTDGENQRKTIKLAHERLIDAWAWLRNLVDENREAIALRARIGDDAQEWEQNQRDVNYLYTGTRLLAAEEQVGAKKVSLSALGLVFVEASRANAETELQRELTQARAQEAAEASARQEAEKSAKSERKARQWLTILAAGLGVLLIGAIWVIFVQSIVLRTRARGETVSVPAGEFVLGRPSESEVPQEHPATWRAHVPGFRMEKYEVTNAQYQLCVQDEACTAPTNRALYQGVPKADLPVVRVTLEQAQDYCAWVWRRLPTEIEWEWAARGEEDWVFPNGDDLPNPSTVNIEDPEMNRAEHRLRVYELEPDKRGTYGLTGNVMEWTPSLWLAYDDPRYRTLSWDGKSEIPPDLLQMAVARGGSWAAAVSEAVSTSRYPISPTEPAVFIGFRCVES